MATSGRINVKAVLLLGLTLFSCVANGDQHKNRRSLLTAAAPTDATTSAPPEDDDPKASTADPAGVPTAAPGGITVDSAGVKVFDVTQFGAKADDKTDNALMLVKTWRAACENPSPSKVVVPAGTFVSSPAVFLGPCKAPIIFEIQGTIKATIDLSEYTTPEWILFEKVDGLVLTGGGVLDGQGAAVWKYNDCKKNSHCTNLPDTVKYSKIKNGVISKITSLNSKYFHFHITDCEHIDLNNLNISAPANSPNTDGMHISNTRFVNVSDNMIGTGDDCVSVGQGVTNMTISRVVCGPGHGISIGSLGKYKDEEDVSGIIVTNCTLKNTTNGARIKTYGGSPPSLANHIIFQDIIMDTVKNPIIIDQKYGSRAGAPSQVKVSDVHFKNIKGTSTSDVAITLDCSSAVPCQGVELADIDLSYVGEKQEILSSSCLNAKVTTVGKLTPGACSAASVV